MNKIALPSSAFIKTGKIEYELSACYAPTGQTIIGALKSVLEMSYQKHLLINNNDNLRYNDSSKVLFDLRKEE